MIHSNKLLSLSLIAFCLFINANIGQASTLRAYYSFEKGPADETKNYDGNLYNVYNNFNETFGVWIMVKAQSLTRQDILNGIKNKTFYSTQGPEFTKISYENGKVAVICPTAVRIEFIGKNFTILKTVYSNSASYDFASRNNGDFVRVRSIDKYQRWAWTNPIMIIQNKVFNPYEKSGNWYKGNTHTHTTMSDGKWALPEVIMHYRNYGYDFLAITDHKKFVNIDDYNEEGLFVTLKGMEFNHNETHLTVLDAENKFVKAPSFPSTMPLQQVIDYFSSNGALVVLNHPNYLQARYTWGTLTNFSNVVGIENFNYIFSIKSTVGYASDVWDEFLSKGIYTGGLSADDAHDFANWPSLGSLGILGKSIEFKDEGQAVKLHGDTLNGLVNVDLDFWIKTSQAQGTIISGANAHTDNEISLRIIGKKILIYLKQKPTFFNVRVLNDNKWHHIVWSRNGDNGINKIYVDGILYGTANLPTGALEIDDDGLWLAQDQDSISAGWNPNQAFLGQIDELKILTDK